MRRYWAGAVLALGALVCNAGCGDDDDDASGGPDAGNTGGASTGGASTGGASTGGASTGGASTGGAGGTRVSGGAPGTGGDGGPSSGGTDGGTGGDGTGGVPEAGPDAAPDAPPVPDAGPVQITIKNVGSDVIYVFDNWVSPAWLAIEGLRVSSPNSFFPCEGEFYPFITGYRSRPINPGEQLVLPYDGTHWVGAMRTDGRGGCALQTKAKAGTVSARICANSTATAQQAASTGQLVQDTCTDLVLELPVAPAEGSVVVNLAAPGSERDQ